ncbi:PSD1 and planctomycete cytochrome C domain-containing protein [Horticoccus sp. 23ND18S-11]|uniref:PSD1 and planctomycete cytochrome C domain-containing protein n=1 Tax=Horticoccus sp. 23ND18S-11 TaxID=3391832 RepID=UPI0039C9C2FA
MLVLIANGGRAALPPAEVEFFETKIRPVLAQDCYECHRTNGKRKGGFALDHRQALLTGGDSGAAIVPGKPAESLLLQAIRHESDDLLMPKAGAKLEPAVIADFERWIRLGAPDPRDTPPTDAQVAADTDWNAVMQRRKGWWSFQPIKKPDLARFPADAGSTHPVDRLLAPGLAAAGLTRAARADDVTRLRRLSYVLRGLPPSPAEIDAFARDSRDDAYTRIVDTWLASPAFGERWARHWMDWVRYADSHGSEGDAPIPYAWRYRDYLIRALNADVPYNQLVREHLAGDLLAAPRLNRELGLNESALGIGHLRMVLHGFAPVDALEEKVRFTDDQINVVSKAFLGLTVSCARCHDHKFDPISQRDFTSWYGIFTSSAPATVAVDAPDPAAGAWRAGLVQRKDAIRAALAAAWLEDAEKLPAQLLAPDPALTKAVAAAKDPSFILHPWFLRQQHATTESTVTNASVLAAWRVRAAAVADTQNRVYPKRWHLSRPEDFAAWRRDGAGAERVSGAGDFAVLPAGDRAVAGPYPAGVFTHRVSSKDRGVILSPPFQLDQSYDVWLRITGEGGAFVRYVVQNYPREGSVYPVQKLVGAPSQWLKLSLDYWQGDQIHLEATTAADQPVLANVAAERSWFGLSDVVFTRAGEPGPIEPWSFTAPLLTAWGPTEPRSAEELARGYAEAVRASVQAWRDDTCTDAQAQYIDGMVRAGLLRNRLDELPGVAPLIMAYREREEAIGVPTRAPGVIETGALDQPLFVRGNHKQPAEIVPRHFLDAIDATPYRREESGRRALADDLLRPDNPLTARVIVNRVWHHVFGRGLVATPDNFGRMGEPPSHPELLDYLAAWFVEHGWSTKALIRFLVTSETWQAASDRPAGAAEKDPDNVAWSHANVRRLEAEAIRDALFAVSGDLKAEPRYGPPVTGRVPRRSVYLRVKRNDLDPFLAVFDAPVPSGPTGRRDVTNVPGQSLTLLNDPLVRELAAHWAKRIEQDATLASADARIAAMYRQAFGREPTAAEIDRSQRFIAQMKDQGQPAPWAELGHALFNLKEFIFIR